MLEMEPSQSPTTQSKKISYQERIKTFENEICKPIIDLDLLRSLAFDGIPDQNGLRSLYWKVLLNYLPLKTSTWTQHLAERRGIYRSFCKELVIDPRAKYEKEGEGQIQDVTHDDHPLNQSWDSHWQAYFNDQETLLEIEKDVKRTFPHLHFFRSGRTDGPIDHYDAVKRILFIYAKLNPGIHYVQGMNEVLGPVYYTFATDPRLDFRECAEEDAFFCFTNLMSEIMNNFCKTLDQTQYGVLSQIADVDKMLLEKDPQLWHSLKERKLEPTYYCFRWITCLLAQDFEMPETLRCWDSLFSDPNRFNFLIYICCAMLITVRDELFMGNFADNLKLLQNFPVKDMDRILHVAKQLRDDPHFQVPMWRLPEPEKSP
eukprot:TRINITY_DN13288_c0_g1_i1.p1 TRINITY_DN13288_c0_g1~~TRINITY_DN13288_c0_g1_i1.p1  ORF type:complete len:373 (+),score=62.57 TRINITY_DN13288_c0_g1_i1:104-1222(+)